MKIFITGASGFIGAWCVREALHAGHQVRVLCRSAKDMNSLPAGVESIVGSLGSVTTAAFDGYECLIHLAASGVDGQATWEQCFNVNVQDSLNVWLKASASGVTRYVICGSCFEYGRSGDRFTSIPVDAPLEPTTPYAASKAAATMAAIAFAEREMRSLRILRPFHVFGEGEPNSRFWPALRAAAFAGKDFPMTGGQQVRDFVPVDLVARSILLSASINQEPGRAKIENIGTGLPRTLLSFAEEWWARWDARGSLKVGALPYRPNEVMRLVPKL